MPNVIFKDISLELLALPDWETMTAYQRALHACRELGKRGQKIPAWTALRSLIGKGSPADLKRAVGDFRVEQAELMVSGDLGLTQLPIETAKLFRDVWSLAVRQTFDKFSSEQARGLQQVEMARHDTAEALVKFPNEKAARITAEKALQEKIGELAIVNDNLAKTILQQDHLLARLQRNDSELTDLRGVNSSLMAKLEILEVELTTNATQNLKLQTQLEKSEKRLDSIMKVS